jgi:hypothetical protein
MSLLHNVAGIKRLRYETYIAQVTRSMQCESDVMMIINDNPANLAKSLEKRPVYWY